MVHMIWQALPGVVDNRLVELELAKHLFPDRRRNSERAVRPLGGPVALQEMVCLMQLKKTSRQRSRSSAMFTSHQADTSSTVYRTAVRTTSFASTWICRLVCGTALLRNRTKAGGRSCPRTQKPSSRHLQMRYGQASCATERQTASASDRAITAYFSPGFLCHHRDN